MKLWFLALAACAALFITPLSAAADQFCFETNNGTLCLTTPGGATTPVVVTPMPSPTMSPASPVPTAVPVATALPTTTPLPTAEPITRRGLDDARFAMQNMDLATSGRYVQNLYYTNSRDMWDVDNRCIVINERFPNWHTDLARDPRGICQGELHALGLVP